MATPNTIGAITCADIHGYSCPANDTPSMMGMSPPIRAMAPSSRPSDRSRVSTWRAWRPLRATRGHAAYGEVDIEDPSPAEGVG